MVGPDWAVELFGRARQALRLQVLRPRPRLRFRFLLPRDQRGLRHPGLLGRRPRLRPHRRLRALDDLRGPCHCLCRLPLKAGLNGEVGLGGDVKAA